MPTLAERLETATTTLEGLVDNTTGTGDMVLKTGAVIAPTSVNGNTITTGTGTLTLGSYTLAIGGNITFSAIGRTLAQAADGATARTAIGAGTSSFDPTAPGPIGGTTPAAGAFTTLAVGGHNIVPGGLIATVGTFSSGGNFATGGTFSTGGTFTTVGDFTAGGAFTTSHAFTTTGGALTLTVIGTTNVTLPTIGTLATESIASAIALSSQGAAIASASTVDLSTATGKVVSITGTTTITALGTVAAGAQFILQSPSGFTITHHSTTMKCQGSVSLVLLAGDAAIATSLGSGNWMVSILHRASSFMWPGAGSNSTRIGYLAVAAGSNAVAVGFNCSASGSGASSFGAGTTVSGANSFGWLAGGGTISGSSSVCFGTASAVSSAVTVGANQTISASGITGLVLIGEASSANYTTVGLGAPVVVGQNASTLADRTTVLGNYAKCTTVSGTAIGYGAVSAVSHGVAIGRGAMVPTGFDNAVSIGFGGGDNPTDVFFDNGMWSKYTSIDHLAASLNRNATTARLRINGMAGADMAGVTGDLPGGDVVICGGRGSGTGVGGKAVLAVAPAGSSGVSKNALVDFFAAAPATGIEVYRTITATVGAVTIDRPSGTANIAAAGTAVTVTNSMVSANSIVIATLRTNDATATIKNVVPSAGSFTVTLTTAATGQVSIGWMVLN